MSAAGDGELRRRLRAPTPAEQATAAAIVATHLAPSPVLATCLAAGTASPGPDPTSSDPHPEVATSDRRRSGGTGGTDGAGGGDWLVLESMQPTGSFKVRGALAALSSLPPERTAVAASAGNHALGLAWAARRLDRAVVLVTAETASPAKLAALAALAGAPGARIELVRHGDGYDAAEAHARRLAGQPGCSYLSAYSDYAVIAGAASIGAELDASFGRDRPLSVYTPLGGGGLASGLALWAGRRPGTRLVAAEAAASPAVGRAVAAGRRVAVEVGTTLADGLAGNLEEGGPTADILAAGVAAGVVEIVDVDEPALAAAIRWLFDAHGLVAEGAAAAALAAALADTGEQTRPAGGDGPTGARVVLVTGRNISTGLYASILAG